MAWSRVKPHDQEMHTMQEDAKPERETKPGREPYRVRLPGFVRDEDVGLGDVIKRATSSVGITPCGGCKRRAETLNSWIVFSGRRSK